MLKYQDGHILHGEVEAPIQEVVVAEVQEMHYQHVQVVLQAQHTLLEVVVEEVDHHQAEDMPWHWYHQADVRNGSWCIHGSQVP